MQCILTRADFDIYYGGEALSGEQPQSFTCPYCKKMGYSDTGLYDHVSAEHTDTGLEVVCPVCAALPGGDPNLVTDDFAGHLTLEHRTGPRDLISFLDEPSAIRHGGVRRITSGRGLGGPRARRSNMHFSSSSGISALSPSGRDSVDPIAELLSQLSGVRRGAPQPSQLQQLQMQIQLERQHVSVSELNGDGWAIALCGRFHLREHHRATWMTRTKMQKRIRKAVLNPDFETSSVLFHSFCFICLFVIYHWPPFRVSFSFFSISLAFLMHIYFRLPDNNLNDCRDDRIRWTVVHRQLAHQMHRMQR